MGTVSQERFGRLMDSQQRILEAAIAIFATDGFALASTNAIAQRAQSSKGLLFHHFHNKEGLYYAAYQHCCAHHLAFLNQCFAQSHNPEEWFLAWIQGMHEYATQHCAYAQLLDHSILVLPHRLQDSLQASQLDHQTHQTRWMHLLVEQLPLRSTLSTEEVVDYVRLLLSSLQGEVLCHTPLDELLQKGARYYEWMLHGVT